MIAKNKADESNIYWIKELEPEMTEWFEKIKADQSFFITDKGKLVISFDKYEVAPGCMGVLEFEIPTEILKDVLSGSEYIK